MFLRLNKEIMIKLKFKFGMQDYVRILLSIPNLDGFHNHQQWPWWEEQLPYIYIYIFLMVVVVALKGIIQSSIHWSYVPF